MNQYKLFAGKAYSFALNKEIKEGPNYDLIVKILSDLDGSLKPISIVDSGSNESYDEYLITSEESLFTLKVSLDKNCQALKNEINFLKENKSLITPKYYSSGLIKSNFSVLFLLTSFEKGLDIDDLGVSYIDSNIKSLLFSLYAFNKLKTSITPEEYFNYFFDNFSVKNGSDFLIENISNNHNIEDIYYVFDQIKDEILSSYRPDIMSGNDTCHGFLSKRNVISRNSVFKFKNLNFTFKGNRLYDFSFLLVSLGLNGRDYSYAIKKYCDSFDLVFKETKPLIDHCTKIASGIYLYKLFFDFLIEESLFLNSRPEKVLSLISDFSNASLHLNRLSCCGSVSEIAETIISKQASD